jgi:hypothetical protein
MIKILRHHRQLVSPIDNVEILVAFPWFPVLCLLPSTSQSISRPMRVVYNKIIVIIITTLPITYFFGALKLCVYTLIIIFR